MDTITALDLARCLFWGLLGIAPLICAKLAGWALVENKDEPEVVPLFLFLAMATQIGFAIALYIAGAKS